MPDDPRDPFKDDRNRVEYWRNRRTGQQNQKIVEGPDAGVHRYSDPRTGRTGQTGPERPGRDPRQGG